jgi:hypothetical protein
LSAGTLGTFILYDPQRPDLEDQRIMSKRVQGAILGRADSAEHCQPLAEITGGSNEEAGYVFYRVAIEGIERMPPYYDFGFGILGLRARRNGRSIWTVEGSRTASRCATVFTG